ncbi:hypothetical protein BDV12DRAFT_36025 [Aspergillus spectabilis]
MVRHLKDTAGTLAKPPGVQGDYRARDLPSPSTSGSADSLEEFLRLPDAPHDDIPVDPLLLADLGPWKPDDLQLLETPVDGLINPDTTGQYPEPPEILHSPTNPSGDPGERDGIQKSRYDCQHVHPSSPSTDPDQPFPGIHRKHQIMRESRSYKQKTRKSDSRIRKLLRVRSMLIPREDSFPALRSQFLCLSLNDRLQFLS